MPYRRHSSEQVSRWKLATPRPLTMCPKKVVSLRKKPAPLWVQPEPSHLYRRGHIAEVSEAVLEATSVYQEVVQVRRTAATRDSRQHPLRQPFEGRRSRYKVPNGITRNRHNPPAWSQKQFSLWVSAFSVSCRPSREQLFWLGGLAGSSAELVRCSAAPKLGQPWRVWSLGSAVTVGTCA